MALFSIASRILPNSRLKEFLKKKFEKHIVAETNRLIAKKNIKLWGTSTN